MSEPDLVGLVRHIRLQLGCTFNVNGPVDPGKVYHVDKKTGWRPIGLQADRALWRNSATLLELSGDEHVQAGALAQLASLGEHGIVPADLVVGLRAFGTIGSRAKVDLWRSETLPIPVHVLANPDRRVLIEDCLGLTGDVERALRSSVWALVCDLVPQTKEEKERKALRDHLDVTRLYWVALETPFKCDVLGAPASADLDQVRRRWGEKCMALARDALVKALNGLAASGRTLQASAGAERTLSYRLQEVRGRHNLN